MFAKTAVLRMARKGGRRPPLGSGKSLRLRRVGRGGGEQLVDHGLRIQSFGLSIEVQRDAMAQDALGDRLHSFDRRVCLTVEHGVRFWRPAARYWAEGLNTQSVIDKLLTTTPANAA